MYSTSLHTVLRRSRVRRARIVWLGISLGIAGCTHPLSREITVFMRSDSMYAALPAGPRRLDAIWEYAKNLAATEEGAIHALGSLSINEGIRLRHPFDTGLTAGGVLALVDKTGHFFAHAMWQYDDEARLIPIAGAFGVVWEVLGEVKSWFSSGNGYDMDDVWANRLGREFGRRLWGQHRHGRRPVTPSDVIRDARAFRPGG